MFAVGDDDQSIYAFRGANAANMQHFERDFSKPDAPVRLIKLEQNYRSHGHILDAANALIRNNATRLGKNLWTSEGKGEPVRAFAAPSDIDEAAFIVDVVKGLADDGVRADQVALLYRATRSRACSSTRCSAPALPYRVYGGMRFFERAEIKHALAYLRLLAEPGDDGAFLRVVNFPPRGIGARTLEQLQDAARAQATSLWQAACSGALKGKAATSIGAFIRLIEAAREATTRFRCPRRSRTSSTLPACSRITGRRRMAHERVENLEDPGVCGQLQHLGCPVRWFPQSGLFDVSVPWRRLLPRRLARSGPPERGLLPNIRSKCRTACSPSRLGELPTPGRARRSW